ncbi:MAG: hypothetical protein LR015_07905 [Verrucomicrobia bacterium]|nr:hypothetical protein [Verrucomicrobiota bacterium]
MSVVLDYLLLAEVIDFSAVYLRIFNGSFRSLMRHLVSRLQTANTQSIEQSTEVLPLFLTECANAHAEASLAAYKLCFA